MVVEAAVLVIDDQQQRALPQIGVGADDVVDHGDKALAGLDVVVGMLVAGQYLTSAGAGVVGIIRLDKAVFRELAGSGVSDKILVEAEEFRLVLQQVRHFQTGTRGIVVVDPGRMTGLIHARVDAENGVGNVEEVHVHVGERGAVVGEGAVAQRGAGDGGEPSVEQRVLGGEGGEYRKLLRGEIAHDRMRLVDARSLGGVAFDEALHVGDPIGTYVSAEDLKIDARKVVVGIVLELSLKGGVGLHGNGVAGCVRVRFVSGETVDFGISFSKGSQHVVKGAVFHHENYDVFEIVQTL